MASPVEPASAASISVDEKVLEVLCENGGEAATQETLKAKVKSGDKTVALLQVVGAFFLMFNTWGVANTYGAFQTFYEAELLSDHSPSQISWIGSIQTFLLMFVGGLATGPIYDAGYLRGLVIVGSVAGVFGLMMTSLCTQYWQLVLAQGICIGIGSGCLMLPSVAVMPQYFTGRRALATGIAASGSSLGGVIYPIVFHELQPRIGFGWATRVIAFIMLGTLAVPITVMRAKSFPSSRRPFFDTQVLRNIPFVLFSMGAAFGFMGMYVPFYYISSYAQEKSITSISFSFYLLTILNASSIFGRLVPNFFADVIGPLNILTPFCALCSVVAFCWPSIESKAPIIIFCIAYGFFSGTFVSMMAPALVTLSKDLALVGTHMGMSFAFGALGLLIGNPVAGVLLSSSSWIGPAMFCGTANMVAAFCILAARISQAGRKIMVKV